MSNPQRPLRVISLGAGVQSTTMYLMSCMREIDRADLAIFADTGWEPRGVYDHLQRLKDLNEIPIEVVTIGSLRDDALDENKTRFASMPLFTKDGRNKVSMLRRQCTREYKVAPLTKRIKEMGATAKNPAEVWIGISTDEIQRMKDSFVKYTYHRWPLIDLRMDRQACKQWLSKHWDGPVIKSACIGCPFHDDSTWQDMKDNRPEEWADAVEFDKAIRQMPRLRDETFLHRSAQPLDEVVFSDQDQLDLFVNECEGMCGL